MNKSNLLTIEEAVKESGLTEFNIRGYLDKHGGKCYAKTGRGKKLMISRDRLNMIKSYKKKDRVGFYTKTKLKPSLNSGILN